MKQYPLVESKAGKAAFGFFLAALLLLSRNTMFTTTVLGFHKSQFLMLGLVCAAGVLFLAVNRRNVKDILLDRRMPVILAFAVVLLLPMLVKRDWQLMYFTVLLCPLVAVFFSYFISWRDVAKCYVVILTVLGVYSVVATYILRLLPDNGIFSVPTFINSHNHMFHNFGLAIVSDVYVKNRNFGIFREPGVYQYFIILSLVLNNYMVSWKKPWVMWLVNVLLAVTMVTTFATGGVAELGLLVLVVFFDKKLYKDKRALTIAIVLVIAAIVIVIVSIIQKNALYWSLWDMVVYKLLMDSNSASDRTMSILINLDIFLHNPLVGDEISTVLYALENNTSSTTLIFAIFGILGGGLHLASWIALVWEKERKLWVNLALLVIMLMAFNTQNLVTDVFLWLLPVMALVQKGLPLLQDCCLTRKV